MKILFIGDVYGQTGRDMIRKFLPAFRRDQEADWVIANGENTSGGRGISLKHRDLLFHSGVDVITTGNHVFARPDWPTVLGGEARILRPQNLGGLGIPGRGKLLLEAGAKSLAVINLAGRVFMDKAECPFSWADRLLAELPPHVPTVLDFHAEATSEKISLAWHLDGRISFMAGTHTHVQTSDERILPRGTGAITDLGMTGPRDGVLGVKRELILHRFRHGYSDRFATAEGPGVMEGVAVLLDEQGKTSSVTRFRLQE
jgi:hypothetical protein